MVTSGDYNRPISALFGNSTSNLLLCLLVWCEIGVRVLERGLNRLGV